MSTKCNTRKLNLTLKTKWNDYPSVQDTLKYFHSLLLYPFEIFIKIHNKSRQKKIYKKNRPNFIINLLNFLSEFSGSQFFIYNLVCLSHTRAATGTFPSVVGFSTCPGYLNSSKGPDNLIHQECTVRKSRKSFSSKV